MRFIEFVIIYFFISGLFANIGLLTLWYDNCGHTIFNALKYGKDYCMLNQPLALKL